MSLASYTNNEEHVLKLSMDEIHKWWLWKRLSITVTSEDLDGTAGDGPPKVEVGDDPCLRPPNISKILYFLI